MRNKIFENVETSLYSQGFVSRIEWNTNDGRYSDFGLFFFFFFLKIWKKSLYIDVSTFLDFAHFLKMWKRLYIETYPHFWILPIF